MKGVVMTKPVEKTTKFVQQTTRMARCHCPHKSKDYPKREKLLTLVTVDNKREFDSKIPLRVNPLQFLNVIHGETPVQKSLMHMHA